jgi:hypothetical protein
MSATALWPFDGLEDTDIELGGCCDESTCPCAAEVERLLERLKAVEANLATLKSRLHAKGYRRLSEIPQRRPAAPVAVDLSLSGAVAAGPAGSPDQTLPPIISRRKSSRLY